MMSVLGTAIMVTACSVHGDALAIVSCAIYGGSLVLLFLASFLHHAIEGRPRLMRCLRTLDYVAIYPLIAGTCTPVSLLCLRWQWLGWTFFGAMWGLAIIGIILQCTGNWPKWASMTMYVTLGWFGGFLFLPVHQCLQPGGCMLLLAGGIAFTGGGVIFSMECPNPVPGRFGFHEIWHICVLIGAALHWAMVWFYVLPVTVFDVPNATDTSISD